jgi:hypothetical protein
MKMIHDIKIEDIGNRQSKYRITFYKDNIWHVLSRTFYMLDDAKKIADKLQARQEDILR